MEVVFLLVPISIVLVFAIAAGFWWSVRSGQFDDLDGPGFKILMDDDRAGGEAKEMDGKKTAEKYPEKK